MRFSFTILLLILFSVCSFAQKNKRPNYNLLWRISGNGLTKPSYLFGTMHLQDNRAFNFNDSVLTKLIQCDAFAMEIHPDSVTRFVASVLLDESKSESIENQMSRKEFMHYDSLMKKNAGLSLTKFKSVKQVQYFMEQRSTRKDKNTFLDGWLYGIARENNKTMVGLEDFRAQLALFQREDSTEMQQFKGYLDSGKFQVDDSFQSLFNLYYEGNIENIYKFSESGSSNDYFKKLIIDRNKNMTDNIVREIHQHSMFIAVGAAHLGGQPGIVNSLREKGYMLTPVSAPFGGTASKYKHVNTAANEKWFLFTSEDGRYSIEMPQAPMPVKTKEMPVTFQTYVDVGNLSVYMVAHLPVLGAVNSQATSKMLDDMTKNLSAVQKVVGSKKIMIDGYEGRELETYRGDIFYKVRIVIKQSKMYMLMVGPSKEGANSPDAKRFLASLKMMAPANSTAASFVDKTGAFTVDMPGAVTTQVMTPRDPTSGKPIKVNIFFSVDNKTGSTCLVRYNDFPAGYVSPNDSTYVHGTLHVLYQAMKGTDLSTDAVDFHGYPSTHFTFTTANRQVKTEGMLTVRGERFYILMNSSTAGADQGTDAFFNSFRFLPCESPSLKKISFPEGIALQVPVTFEADSAIVDKVRVRQYSFVDRLSGTMFTILKETFSKYREEESVDTLFKSLGEKYTDKKGTLLRDSVIAGKLPSHDYLFQSEKRNARVRIRSVLAGKSMISLWGYFAPDAPELADKIFNSFTVTSTSDWNILSDKSDVILNDLSSADSTTRDEANTALSGYDFKISQLPGIYRALQKRYDDDGEEWGGTRSRLFGKLHEVHDERTQKFIEDLYPMLPDSTLLRDKALKVLSSLRTNQSVKRMAEIIATDSSGYHFSSYYMIQPLTDSLSLLSDVGVSLLNSFSKFEESSRLLSAIKMALDSNVFASEPKQQIISQLTDIAAKIADSHLAEDADGYDDLIGKKYTIADVLLSLPFTSQVNEIVKKLNAENDDDIKLACLKVRLKNNAIVAQQDIDLLASKRSMRLSLYEELLKYKKQNLMGKKYTTPQMLAESEVYEYLMDDDESPEKIELIKEKKVIVNGEKKKIFVFTFRYEESDGAYIVVAGPYPLNVTEFTRGDFTSSLYEKYQSEKQLAEKLSQYLAEKNVTLAD